MKKFHERLRLPLVVAPMFSVSSRDLVVAACRAGVIGAFPTANCRSVDDLDALLVHFGEVIKPQYAPYCANLVIKRADLHEHLEVLCRHRVELVITSVGSPEHVIDPLHEAGSLVFADVATLDHARKAVARGVDGLVLLSAGAGGQSGSLNGLAFARAVREFFEGPIILAGGISDGASLWAALALGCDLGYMGTRFIATHESAASERYKQMLVECDLDDILLSSAFTGLPTNMLEPSLRAQGIVLGDISPQMTHHSAQTLFGAVASDSVPRRWTDIWSAGHSVSGVKRVIPVTELVNEIHEEFHAAVRFASATCWAHASKL
ncbi:NAD(P)H-dependent flavin oxidoreductase [Brevundimonas sp.]|uniref:NAD(P)H-dependent flavin oxidoreductase n=1 Tax=Brevundimonas sp. TaxID=1871086 RepID=UPI003918CDC4